MATGAIPPNRLHNAHYHPMKVTQAWAAFVTAMGTEAKASAAKRKAREAQRRRETTYARDELGST
jgi:hypothetical protein